MGASQKRHSSSSPAARSTMWRMRRLRHDQSLGVGVGFIAPIPVATIIGNHQFVLSAGSIRGAKGLHGSPELFRRPEAVSWCVPRGVGQCVDDARPTEQSSQRVIEQIQEFRMGLVSAHEVQDSVPLRAERVTQEDCKRVVGDHRPPNLVRLGRDPRNPAAPTSCGDDHMHCSCLTSVASSSKRATSG